MDQGTINDEVCQAVKVIDKFLELTVVRFSKIECIGVLIIIRIHIV